MSFVCRLLGRCGRHVVIWWLLLVVFQINDIPPGDPVPSVLAVTNITLTKTVEIEIMDTFPTKVRFTSFVNHTADSTDPAQNLTLTDGSLYFDIYFGENFIGPSMSNPNFTITYDRLMAWKEDPLDVGDEMTLSYVASPNTDLPDGISYLSSNVQYESGSWFTIQYDVCVNKHTLIETNMMYQYGFVVLALFVGMLAGILVLVLFFIIFYKVKRRSPFDSGEVSPLSPINTTTMNSVSKSPGLITNVKGSMRKGANTLLKPGQDASGQSIVKVLSVQDKLKALRLLNEMDIGNTAEIDQQLETERNAAMTDATKLLIQSLVKNGDLPSSAKDKCLSNFKKKVDKLDKDLNEDFQKSMEDLLKEISLKNKTKLAELAEKQEDDREAMVEKTKHMNKQERNQIMELLKTEQATELSELTHQLELDQKEQLEKLRKERVIHKRMGIKSLQQELLDDVKKQGQLSNEQADWLMKEHFKSQSAIEHAFDEEISHQRMLLEEKLALKRSLVENKEIQEEADNELLNLVAEQQISLVGRAKKNNILSGDEAAAMMDSIKADIIKSKDNLDTEKKKQEDILQKKLSQRKKKKIEELLKSQKQEMAEQMKLQAQEQTKTVYTDPATEVLRQQQLHAQFRAELTALENKIDREDFEEHGQLCNQFFEDMKKELIVKKDNLVDELKSQGMTSKELKEIMAKHERQQEDLINEQEDWKLQQSKKLKKQLAKRRAEWQQRRQLEIVEQENLREYEDNVIRKLMDNQVALSEEERELIMHEHQKQMVTIENSLTLSKLQQQRMLEEKLVKKRNQQMEKLHKRHTKEARKLARANDDDDDDEETSELEMLKRQAEDRLAVLRGETLKLDDDVDEIQMAMLKERANALKEQEVKLGTMLAQLQIEKAKEMAKIEQQQKAIHNLKSSLMDDLNERGMLSDPKCQKVIELHQKQQEKLNKKLETDREKQESALRQRLQARLRQKEQYLEELQQQQMKEVASKESRPGAAAKLRQAALATRHMLEMEKFRNRMENEITQTLQEMKRRNEIRRIETLQQQELQFINGLVRMGKFRADELNNIVLLLFPNKSETERKELLGNLMEGTSQTKNTNRSESETDLSIEGSTIEQRILANTMANLKTIARSGHVNGKRKLKKRGVSTMDDLPLATSDYPDVRLEPLGRNSPEGYYGDEFLPPQRLPPLNKQRKKKKSVSIHEDYDS